MSIFYLARSVIFQHPLLSDQASLHPLPPSSVESSKSKGVSSSSKRSVVRSSLLKSLSDLDLERVEEQHIILHGTGCKLLTILDTGPGDRCGCKLLIFFGLGGKAFRGVYSFILPGNEPSSFLSWKGNDPSDLHCWRNERVRGHVVSGMVMNR
jgi:hypothetical protein